MADEMFKRIIQKNKANNFKIYIHYLQNPFAETPIYLTGFHPGQRDSRPGCISGIVYKFRPPSPSQSNLYSNN